MQLKTFALCVLLTALLGTTACSQQAASPSATPPPPTIPSGMVDVGGYALFITCSGAGRPVVILEAGSGYGVGEWWGELPQRVSQFTQGCMYDRAGIGLSDPPSSQWRTA